LALSQNQGNKAKLNVPSLFLVLFKQPENGKVSRVLHAFMTSSYEMF